MKRKPNATLRHHSSICMLKHNHTASWLRAKSDAARKLLFIKARKSSKKLKETQREYEITVLQQRKQIISEIKHKKEMLKKKRKNELKDIEQNVRKMGGIVRSRDELESILKSCKSVKAKKEKLRYQLLYCKNMLDLSLTSSYSMQQTVLQLKQNLIETLKLDTIREIETGTWIVASYEDNWYPGEVQDSLLNKFIVKFMSRKNNSASTFIWPRKDDIQEVENKFIIFSHFDILPSPGLRYWIVPNIEEVEEKHQKFVDTYFKK